VGRLSDQPKHIYTEIVTGVRIHLLAMGEGKNGKRQKEQYGK